VRDETSAKGTQASSTAPARRRTRLQQVMFNIGIYGAIIIGTLVVLDIVLITLGLFPPTYDYGNRTVGWVAALPTGRTTLEGCLDLATKKRLVFVRNGDGMRTRHASDQLRQNDELFKVAVSGDSHTELCAPNEQTHFGVMEEKLNQLRLNSAVFTFGAGKYSPLQAYLAVRDAMRMYSADALVLNLYTGNDFYDMLRVDDRPHLVRAGNGYRIADPVWYQLDDPKDRHRSRVLFALKSVAQKTGIRRVWLRVHYLRDVAASTDAGLGTIIAYMNDLRKSASSEVEYSHAFSAQMLNQQLFFKRFPGTREESLNRVRALLELVRKENPGRLLVMSPIPSYQLVHEQPVDRALINAVERLPITYAEGVAEEARLYHALKQLAAETGWLFVENLEPLRQYNGSQPLYNTVDYHIEPVASGIIGETQARAIVQRIRETATPSPNAQSQASSLSSSRAHARTASR
jgi:hypothetical protein